MSIPAIEDYSLRPLPLKVGGKRLASANLDGEPPLFSVITVVKDNADQLMTTIDSLIAQTCQDFEYIVIDGGSTDETLAMIDRYQHCIDFWCSEPDQGIYDAMNKGIARARGKIVATLNAGDIYRPDTLAVVGLAYAQAGAGDVIMAGGLAALTKNGFCMAKPAHAGWGKWLLVLHQPALFVTRSTYQNLGLFDPQYQIAGDYDFALRVCQQVPLIFLSETLTQMSPEGVSSNYYAATLEAHQARLANDYPHWLAMVIVTVKLLRVFVHLLLERWRVWPVLEKMRHQSIADSSQPSS